MRGEGARRVREREEHLCKEGDTFWRGGHLRDKQTKRTIRRTAQLPNFRRTRDDFSRVGFREVSDSERECES